MICFERLLSSYDRAHCASCNVRLLVDQLLGRCQRCEVVPARSRRAIAAAEIKMNLCDAELLADCNPHAVAPIGIRNSLLERIDAVTPPPLFILICRRTRNNPNIVAL